MNENWEIKEWKGGKVVVPKFDLRCCFCGGKMLLHDFICVQSRGFKHVDVHVKCSNCGWWTIFGLATDEKIWMELRRSKHHNKIFREDVLELIEDEEVKEKVGRRLKEWGYW